MKNPWTKRNPLLSMWLSGANTVLGSARSRAVAESKRQAATAMTKTTRQLMELWTNPLSTTQPRKKRRKRH